MESRARRCVRSGQNERIILREAERVARVGRRRGVKDEVAGLGSCCFSGVGPSVSPVAASPSPAASPGLDAGVASSSSS